MSLRSTYKPLENVTVANNQFVGLGSGAISVTFRSSTQNDMYINTVNISDNVIRGYLCGNRGVTGVGSHYGITIAGNVSSKTGCVLSDVLVDGNVVDAVAP